MILTILDKDLEVVGDIDDAISFIWDKHYREAGYVEIYAAVTPRTVALLKEGYYITRDDDPCVARIHSIATETNEEGVDVIIASAKFVQNVLGQRIIWNRTRIYGNAELVARSLIIDNCMSPTDAQGNAMRERIIGELTMAEAHGLPDRLNETQVSYKNLLEYVLEICATFHYGLRAIMKTAEKKIAIDIYAGTDRSYRQTAQPHVVFSQENENLIGFSYKYDKSTTVNVVRVAGEGEGAARIMTNIGTASGLDRFEVFVDARDISSTITGEDGSESVAYTPEEYKAMLEERGLLSMAPASESIDASVDLSRSYEYRRDFDVGDVVTIHDLRTGAYVNARLMSVLESEDSSGYTLTPTFAVDY